MPPVPEEPRLEPHYGWIAAGIALVILYGSFFPFQFSLHDDPRGPLGVLLDSGFQPSTRDDVVANILLYIPLGFFAAYALRARALTAVLAVTLAGFCLSLFVEVVQYYFVGRFQELTDLSTNTLGSLLGAAAAVAVRRKLSSPYLALMLACWLGNRWYPAHPPLPVSLLPLDLFRYFAAWLAVALMLETLCGEERGRLVFPGLLAVSLLVRAVMVDVQPAEIAGGAAAAILWCVWLWRLPARAVVVPVLFVALIAVLALEPFHFSESARAFGWFPFRSFLEAGTETAIRSFFEKAFLYGGMVWVLVRAGLSTGASAAFGAVLVFGLRISQVYLPGRSAEITDTILLLMLAGMMKLSSEPKEKA